MVCITVRITVFFMDMIVSCAGMLVAVVMKTKSRILKSKRTSKVKKVTASDVNTGVKKGGKL